MSSVTFRKMHQKIATKKIETEIILGPVTKQRVPTMYKLFCFFQTFWDKKYYFLFDNLHDVSAECLDAYTLFRYMQKKNIPCKYIVNIHNKLYKQIACDKDVIGIKGKKSLFKELFWNLLMARCVLGSSYNSSEDDELLRMNPEIEYVYLDHGVIFFNEACVYRYTPQYFNKLIIKNNLEKDMLMRKSDWNIENLIPAGLPRWDNLKNTAKKKEIFLFFTWRGSFNPKYFEYVKQTSDVDLSIRNFEYFEKIKNLLHNKRLNALLKKYNVELCYGVHHALLDICKLDKELFQNTNIRLAEIGNISREVKQASMLITDYSSIAFDFMYQNNPVLFYRMDVNDPNLCKEDKMNLENAISKDSFVYNCLYREEDVVDKIEFYIKNNFLLESKHAEKNRNFFYYKKNICEKIVKALVK